MVSLRSLHATHSTSSWRHQFWSWSTSWPWSFTKAFTAVLNIWDTRTHKRETYREIERHTVFRFRSLLHYYGLRWRFSSFPLDNKVGAQRTPVPWLGKGTWIIKNACGKQRNRVRGLSFAPQDDNTAYSVTSCPTKLLIVSYFCQRVESRYFIVASRT